MSLSALGVVFGDIGTSPLYAVRECFGGAHAVAATPGNILGVLSLIVWSLTVVVSIKYIIFIMRADNRGEGGIFALLALLPGSKSPTRSRLFTVTAALFGAALLYGDGAITPAISVMSAVEGLEVSGAAGKALVVPVTCAILAVLFLIQSRGTGRIGRVFGPVMLLWFVAIAAMGVAPVLRHPGVLRALNPVHAVRFFVVHGWHGFVILGAVVLCITGGEALYADMGQFGRRPIRLSWFVLVFPSLMLNYFGQGALLLEHPGEARGNVFFALVPRALHYPTVVLAAVATTIASQALISGAFSLTRQAIQLRFMPRMEIVHTSSEHEGQLYIPTVNALLAMTCLALVVGFRSSSRLAGAYGIAVTGTMTITTMVFYVVATQHWKWSVWRALPLCAAFFTFDLAFFGANLVKVTDGGWFPLLLATGVMLVMRTWDRGQLRLREQRAAAQPPMSSLLEQLKTSPPVRVGGTAVFFAVSDAVPTALSLQLKHNQVLHQTVLIVQVEFEREPSVPEAEHFHAERLAEGIYRVRARFGFMESPDLKNILRSEHQMPFITDPEQTTFFLLQENVLVQSRWDWRMRLFGFLERNASSPAKFLRLPAERVVELGTVVRL